MSWWDAGSGRVLGDGPADVLTLALQSVVQDRAEQEIPMPDLPHFLSALSAALGPPAAPGPAVIGRLVDGSVAAAARDATGDVEDTGDRDLTIALREALAEVDRQYRERWDREPDLIEVLDTVSFALVGAPELFLSDPDAGALDGIELDGIEDAR
jgi:hypothetical protein